MELAELDLGLFWPATKLKYSLFFLNSFGLAQTYEGWVVLTG